MKFGREHQVSLGSQLLLVAWAPAETYEKVPKGLECWMPCSKPHSQRDWEPSPGVQQSHKCSCPRPAPFSLVCQIFPSIVRAVFLVRRPCLWLRVPQPRVRYKLLAQPPLPLPGSSAWSGAKQQTICAKQAVIAWLDSTGICASRKSAASSLC